MYRIPADLDLNDIIDSAIHLIGWGRYQIQFHFDSGRYISVESRIEIWRKDELISTWNDRDQWSNQRLQDLFEVQVRDYRVESETTLAIYFVNDYTLRFFDESDQYESMQIEPGTIII